MQWNRTAGSFEIRITAAKGEVRAGTSLQSDIEQSGQGLPAVRSSGGHGGHKWVWIALGAGAAAVGGTVAAHSGLGKRRHRQGGCQYHAHWYIHCADLGRIAGDGETHAHLKAPACLTSREIGVELLAEVGGDRAWLCPVDEFRGDRDNPAPQFSTNYYTLGVTPVALSIAGSDPSGGAGIQADLKTFHRFGVYGEAIVTLITVQNTQGVQRVQMLSPELVTGQIAAVVDDIPPGAAKVGALGSRGVVEAVAQAAQNFAFPLVVDTVMISKSGTVMMDAEARWAFVEKLLPRALLLTPNLPEAAELTGFLIRDRDSMARAAEKLQAMGAANVLVKGGHLQGDAVDILLTAGGEFREFPAARIATSRTHGTGCTYSAAITAGLAVGKALADAVACAKVFITEAIRTAPALGHGSGPLNHFAR
jgi:hydroxymethylpyrimidine/phosphomethylpyrimidine kinase